MMISFLFLLEFNIKFRIKAVEVTNYIIQDDICDTQLWNYLAIHLDLDYVKITEDAKRNNDVVRADPYILFLLFNELNEVAGIKGNDNFDSFPIYTLNIQGDQLNIAVFFWYFVKTDLSSERCSIHWTSYKVPETHSHV